MYEYTFLSIKFKNRRYKEYREKDVCIRVSVGGKDYVIFMLATCYGNKWHLVMKKYYTKNMKEYCIKNILLLNL